MKAQYFQRYICKTQPAIKALKQTSALLCALTLTTVLASCGSDQATTGGGGGGAGGGSTFALGTGTGTGFTDAALDIAIRTIAPQASTTISVNVVNEASRLLYTSAATLTFSSTCSIQGLASFSTSQVTTTTGSASVTYTDIGCTSDTITVSATDPAGNSHTATGTITISAGGGGTSGPVRIGNGTGVGFTNGTLSIATPSISAGGSTAVVANIVDANGALVTSSTAVSFSSTCSAAATATFSSNSVTTTTGTATVTYTAAGCVGADTITAATTSLGSSITATGTVTVAAPTLGSIQFTSNSDSTIALAGTGSTSGISENSVVTFTVLDGAGNPLTGQTVNFTLNTTTGGITLAAASDVSDALGLVQATVQSGSVATSVRVTATVPSSVLSTQSTPIVISTGLPDQGSMSLSAATLNPRAWNQDGTTVAITARLADRYNNPIQNGTSVLFTTELGAIGNSCTTTNGACSVNWTSSNPRGSAGSTNNAGRTNILATVLGEEDFVDVNSNGRFDTGDSFTDLPEAFIDANENGIYDSGERFTDLNNNLIYDAADGFFNGVGCTHPTLCSPTQTISVRGETTLVMSEDNGIITHYSVSGAAPVVPQPTSINLRTQSSLSIRLLGTANEQLLPSGTLITFGLTKGSITAGGTQTLGTSSANPANFTATDLAGPGWYTVYFSAPAGPADATTGALTITVTRSNSGGTFGFAPITVTN